MDLKNTRHSIEGKRGNPHKSKLFFFYKPASFSTNNSLAKTLGMPMQQCEVQREKKLIPSFCLLPCSWQSRASWIAQAKAALNGVGGVGLTHAESSQPLYTCPGEKSGQLLLLRLFPLTSIETLWKELGQGIWILWEKVRNGCWRLRGKKTTEEQLGGVRAGRVQRLHKSSNMPQVTAWRSCVGSIANRRSTTD